MQLRSTALFGGCLLTVFAATEAFGASLTSIGFLDTTNKYSDVRAITPDGQYVVGTSANASNIRQPAIWTQSGGLASLAATPYTAHSYAAGVGIRSLAGGTGPAEIVISGQPTLGGSPVTYNIGTRYNAAMDNLLAGTWSNLPGITSSTAVNVYSIHSLAVAEDGNHYYIVGMTGSSPARAYVYTGPDDTYFDSTGAGTAAAFYAVAKTGRCAGYDNSNPNTRDRALYWTSTGGFTAIPPAETGFPNGYSLGISNNGDYIVGPTYAATSSDTDYHGFLHKAGESTSTTLLPLPGDKRAFPVAVSDDGEIVAGYSLLSGRSPNNNCAVVWRKSDHYLPYPLFELLKDMGADVGTFTWLAAVRSMSVDGMTIGGYGLTVSNSLTTGFVANLEPGGRSIVLFQDDFENGLGKWTAMSYRNPQLPTENNDTPELYPNHSGMQGPKTPYAGQVISQAAGFSKPQGEAYDETGAEWIQRQFPAAITPSANGYIIEMTVDLYAYSASSDLYGIGNRVYLLTDASYDNVSYSYDGALPAGTMFREELWADNSTERDGRWVHHVPLTMSGSQTASSTGNLEVRLLQHDKNHADAECVAWDNLHIVIKDASTQAVLWTLDEDFEDGLAGWTAKVYQPVNNDTPRPFSANDPNLKGGNLYNPGSQSAGYYSNLSASDSTHAWMQRLIPGAVAGAGAHTLRLEADWYVYKNNSDPWSVGNLIYLLTGDQYNNPNLFEPISGAALMIDRWPKRYYFHNGSGDIYNGKWMHVDLIRPITTDATGNIELRLYCRDKYTGEQVVAWDNVKLSLWSPCHAPRYDADDDEDVDQSDFAVFQGCISGDGIPFAAGCDCMNSNTDNDVDTADLLAFEGCASGPGVAANPNCDLAPPQP
jgi:hypothetical protein